MKFNELYLESGVNVVKELSKLLLGHMISTEIKTGTSFSMGIEKEVRKIVVCLSKPKEYRNDKLIYEIWIHFPDRYVVFRSADITIRENSVEILDDNNRCITIEIIE